MKVSELIQEVRECIVIRDSTWKCWLKAAKPIATMDVADIDRRMARTYWKTQLKPVGTLSKDTCRRRLSLLAGIWNQAIEEDIIDTPNYWYGESRKIPKGNEYSKYGKEYPVRPFSRYQELHQDPFFMAIWLHGFRVGEICGMVHRDIRFDNDIPYFDIRDNINRLIKPGSQREVPMHPLFYPHLSNLESQLGTVTGKNWSQKRMSEKLDLPTGEAAHSLRHNFITRCRDADLQDSVISKLVGHRVTGMTAKYGTWTLEKKYKAIQQVQL